MNMAVICVRISPPNNYSTPPGESSSSQRRAGSRREFRKSPVQTRTRVAHVNRPNFLDAVQVDELEVGLQKSPTNYRVATRLVLTYRPLASRTSHSIRFVLKLLPGSHEKGSLTAMLGCVRAGGWLCSPYFGLATGIPVASTLVLYHHIWTALGPYA